MWFAQFNSGWQLHVDEQGVDAEDVWSVKNGVIDCKGVPRGYMRTEGKYKNYVLHFQLAPGAGTQLNVLMRLDFVL